MTLRRAVLAAAAAFLLPPGLAGAQVSSRAPAADQAPTFRSSVDLVSVAAVVRDRKGRFVADLSREDFVVVEGGEAREIVGFSRENDGPIKLAVLFDISGSMRVGSKADDARQAARHVLSGLRPGDEAALYAFDTQLQRVHGFTSDFGKLEGALDRVDPPYGQTSLYDAIAETARSVAEEAGVGETGMQRSAVIVLTDGIDTRSRLTPPEVSGIASAIDVPVYVLAVMSAIDDPRYADDEDEGRNELTSGLKNLAWWTGGDLFIASAPAHMSAAARQIVGELRNQYLIAFEASTRPGWRPLEIRTRSKGLIVRARSGYTVAGGRAGM